MKSYAHIVACRDEDILDRCVSSIAGQVDQVIVAIGESWWDGFRPPDKSMKVQEQMDMVYGLQLRNVKVIIGAWAQQADHRTACVSAAVQCGMSPGDMLVKVDSDEFFHDDDMGKIKAAFEKDESLMSMCVPRMDFWAKDRVLCDKREYPYSHHMQIWRYTDGAYFRPTMTLCCKDKSIYPHNRLAGGKAKFADSVGAEGVKCFHYDGVRSPEAAVMKFQAFEHRRRAGAALRPQFFKVWEAWQKDREAVEATVGGVATERNRWVGTMHVDVEHPTEMCSYPWLK